MESDRFLNPYNMACIPWGHHDLTGRKVCADSFYTKRAGCNSALDRVGVESELRPDYSAYVTLNMSGIEGSIHDHSDNTNTHQRSGHANKYLESRKTIGGGFNNHFQATNYDTCRGNSYEVAMAQEAKRRMAHANNSYENYQNMKAANNGCGY
jgi:hypothetical protein